MRIRVNKKTYEVDLPPEMPLLWVLRDHLQLTGTKFGCLKGLCGSCSVLIDGEIHRSCITTLGEVVGKEITTIEGIPSSHPVKRAWKEVEVPQCGYCQSGQIVTAYALISRNRRPSEEEIVRAMKGNLCRCGTYPRIVKAVKRAGDMMP